MSDEQKAALRKKMEGMTDDEKAEFRKKMRERAQQGGAKLVYWFTLFGTPVSNHSTVAFCASFPHENAGKAGMGAYPQASPPSPPLPGEGVVRCVRNLVALNMKHFTR